ncbi:hypothetical protein V5O48_018604 [Marasmius crinis-equi]|uniref:Uncharacterized protein n=1 Tax=Marasmius crinis-equi TaxID=585013 RepID=A0ABR3EKT0_9AGAR
MDDPTPPIVSNAPIPTTPSNADSNANANANATNSPPASQSSTLPTKPVGRPTKVQVKALKLGFHKIDELFHDLAKEANLQPQYLLQKYLKWFVLSRGDNSWNTYQSFASAPENLMEEMSRLEVTEHDNVYQLLLANPDLKPTTTQMRLAYQLFMKEHGQEEGRDILASWEALTEMDEIPGCQQKADRKCVFDAQTSRLTKMLNMLRNVYQMHFSVIGVGGQVHTDAGLNFFYDNYESEGFVQVGWLKTSDRVLAFFKTHVYKKTMEEYTDQELVSLAQDRGFLVTRKDGAPLNTSYNVPPASLKKSSTAAPSRKATAAPPKKATASNLTASSSLPPKKATSRAATNAGASIPAEQSAAETSNGKRDDRDLSTLKDVILDIAGRGNITFSGKPGSLPWNSFHKDCWNRGIQLNNYPASVTLPWKMPSGTARKKGIWGLSIEMQHDLLQACLWEKYPVRIIQVEALQIQTNTIPIVTVVDDAGNVTKKWFAQDINELKDKPNKPSTRRAIKAKCDIEPAQPSALEPPSVFTDNYTAKARPIRPSSEARSVRFKEDEDEDNDKDELEEEDEDPHGIESTGSSDYEYGAHPSTKWKRADKGKGKALSEDEDATPRPKQKPPPSKRVKETPNTSAQLDPIAGNPHRVSSNKSISMAEFNAAGFTPTPAVSSISQAEPLALPTADPSGSSSSSSRLVATGAAGRSHPHPTYRATPNPTTAPSPVPSTSTQYRSNPPHYPQAHYPPPTPTIPGQPSAPPAAASNTLALLARLGINAAELRSLLFNTGNQPQPPQHAAHPATYSGVAGGSWGVPQAPPSGPAKGMNAQGSSNGQGNGGMYYGGPGGGLYNPGGPSGHRPGPSA